MKFTRALVCIVIVSFGVRVAYVAFAKSETCVVDVAGVERGSYPSECAVGDQLFYNTAANQLADGEGFVEPLWAVDHPGEDAPPAADHPPLTILVLAPVSFFVERPPLAWIAGDGLDANVREHRYAMVVLGTLLVGLVGLLGRRLGGNRVGLVAAGIMALSPNVWINDGLVMSETAMSCVVVATLWLAVVAVERATIGRIAALGAFCGLGALARAELLLFVPLLAIPIALRTSNWWRDVALVVGASILVVLPWVAFNVSRFEEPTLISTNDGLALAASNCDPVYHGAGTGLTSYEASAGCVDDPPPPGDQSEVSRVYRERALEYIDDHLGRAAVVATARVGRTWSLFRPIDMVEYNTGEGRETWATRLGIVVFYPTLVAAVAGTVVLVRRRAFWNCWILLVPVVTVTLASAVTYGQTRFRAAAEPSLALFAAIAVVALVSRVRRGSTPPPLAVTASHSPARDS